MQQSPVFNGKCSHYAKNGCKCLNYAKNSGLCFFFWMMLFEADYAKHYASILYQCLHVTPSKNYRWTQAARTGAALPDGRRSGGDEGLGSRLLSQLLSAAVSSRTRQGPPALPLKPCECRKVFRVEQNTVHFFGTPHFAGSAKQCKRSRRAHPATLLTATIRLRNSLPSHCVLFILSSSSPASILHLLDSHFKSDHFALVCLSSLLLLSSSGSRNESLTIDIWHILVENSRDVASSTSPSADLRRALPSKCPQVLALPRTSPHFGRDNDTTRQRFPEVSWQRRASGSDQATHT